MKSSFRVVTNHRPSAPRTILAGLGLVVVSWSALPYGTIAAQENAIARAHALRSSPTAPNVLFSATPRGLLVSHDRGRNWSSVPIDRTDAEVFDVALHPRGEIIAARRDGLWQMHSPGQWKRLSSPTLEPSVPVLVSLFERRPNIMFVGTARHGVFRTENGGQSWRRADNGLPVSGQ